LVENSKIRYNSDNMAALSKENQQSQSTLKNPEGTVREGIPDQPAKLEPEKSLFSWRAASRPFKRRDREFWITVLGIAGLCGVVLFLIEGVMPVILIISLVFLFYILSTVEPEEINYEITNKGIKIAGRRTDKEVLNRFWFSKRFDSELLVFEMLVLPGRLEVVINPKDKETIK